MRFRRHKTERENHQPDHGPDLSRSAHDRVMVHHADVASDGTHLCLLDGRTLRLPTLPDRAGAPRVHSVLRRVLHVEIVIAGDRSGAAVQGLGHRRECALPVSLGTALALAVEGSPTVVNLLPP